MMFSINPAFDIIPTDDSVFTHLDNGFNTESFIGVEPKRAELYRLCEQKNIGITVMKTLGAGKLISPEHTPFSKPLTTAQCIHYALSRSGVASVLLGCKTPEEILDSVKYLSLSEAERDYTGVLSSIRGGFHGSCVYCNHCQPCPSNIDIATVNKYLDIALVHQKENPDNASSGSINIPPSILSHYQSLKHKGNECIKCGNCENRCPFGVSIIGNMEKADKLLG
ncbi:MAG: hypothetical protein FWD13_13060 [Treponema sp.]|nr:hypothetical protein [Treponema sp.]